MSRSASIDKYDFFYVCAYLVSIYRESDFTMEGIKAHISAITSRPNFSATEYMDFINDANAYFDPNGKPMTFDVQSIAVIRGKIVMLAILLKNITLAISGLIAPTSKIVPLHEYLSALAVQQGHTTNALTKPQERIDDELYSSIWYAGMTRESLKYVINPAITEDILKSFYIPSKSKLSHKQPQTHISPLPPPTMKLGAGIQKDDELKQKIACLGLLYKYPEDIVTEVGKDIKWSYDEMVTIANYADGKELNTNDDQPELISGIRGVYDARVLARPLSADAIKRLTSIYQVLQYGATLSTAIKVARSADWDSRKSLLVYTGYLLHRTTKPGSGLLSRASAFVKGAFTTMKDMSYMRGLLYVMHHVNGKSMMIGTIDDIIKANNYNVASVEKYARGNTMPNVLEFDYSARTGYLEDKRVANIPANLEGEKLYAFVISIMIQAGTRNLQDYSIEVALRNDKIYDLIRPMIGGWRGSRRNASESPDRERRSSSESPIRRDGHRSNSTSPVDHDSKRGGALRTAPSRRGVEPIILRRHLDDDDNIDRIITERSSIVRRAMAERASSRSPTRGEERATVSVTRSAPVSSHDSTKTSPKRTVEPTARIQRRF